MKPLLLAAAVLLSLPVAAQAQVAAGSTPNSFDGPAAPVQAAPVQAAPSAPAAVETPVNPASEETLRAIIAGAQSGVVDYTLMTDDLAARVREQEATILPLIVGFGPLVTVDFVGSQTGADLFTATFANAATQWVIGFDEAGKVAALLFRPAPAPGED